MRRTAMLNISDTHSFGMRPHVFGESLQPRAVLCQCSVDVELKCRIQEISTGEIRLLLAF